MGKGRAPCCDKSKVKRGPWSPAEDLALITFIQKYGHENWRALPKQAGLLRCGKSCRLRWINYLRPDVKRGNFTKEEEGTIIKLHETLGNKWSKIASYLPGRTDNEIKNVWNTHLKKRLGRKSDSDLSADESGLPSSSSRSSSNRKGKMGTKAKHRPYDHGSSAAKKPKDSPSSSNSSGNSNMFDSEHYFQLDTLFDFTEPFWETNYGIQDIDQPDEVDIPISSDIDIWDLLDGLDSLQQSDEANMQEFAMNQGPEDAVKTPPVLHKETELDSQKWFQYLEDELGLKDENQENMAEADMSSFFNTCDRLQKQDATLVMGTEYKHCYTNQSSVH